MGKREISIGAAAVSAILLLVGVLSHSWWTIKAGSVFGGPEVNFGLRSAEMCRAGSCVEISYAVVAASGGIFKSVAAVTYFGGILAVIMLAIGVGMREMGGDDRVARSAGGLATLVILTTILCAFSFPGRGSPSLGYAFWFTLLGSVGCAASAFLGGDLGLGWEGKEYVPISSLTDPSAAEPKTAQSPYREPTKPTPAAPPPASETPNAVGHRIEYSRKVANATSSATPAPRPGARRRPKVSDVGPAAVDSVRSTLRFVARSVELSEAGLDVVTEAGEQRVVAWADIDAVIARRLPPDPPFDKTLFVDIVPTSGAPVRLVPSTKVNYHILPGTGATSTENFRRLGWFMHHKFPTVIEEASKPFFLESKVPPLFQAVKLFADYDAQYAGS